jgi:hypothetical protein
MKTGPDHCSTELRSVQIAVLVRSRCCHTMDSTETLDERHFELRHFETKIFELRIPIGYESRLNLDSWLIKERQM